MSEYDWQAKHNPEHTTLIHHTNLPQPTWRKVPIGRIIRYNPVWAFASDVVGGIGIGDNRLR